MYSASDFALIMAGNEEQKNDALSAERCLMFSFPNFSATLHSY